MMDGANDFELYLEHMLPSVVSVTKRVSLLEYVVQQVLGRFTEAEDATNVIRLGRSVIFVLENIVKDLSSESGCRRDGL